MAPKPAFPTPRPWLLRRPPGAPTITSVAQLPSYPFVVVVKLEKPLVNGGRGEPGLVGGCQRCLRTGQHAFLAQVCSYRPLQPPCPVAEITGYRVVARTATAGLADVVVEGMGASTPDGQVRLRRLHAAACAAQ